MREQDTPEDEPVAHGRDAVDVSDFVYAATDARVRRLTLPDGAHWFPAVDVARNLGYTNTRQALLWHVSPDCRQSLGDLARGVYGADASRRIAGHGLKKSMKMVSLAGLVQLVNGCTKHECAPFRRWVADVVATVQRDGAYELVPAPVQPDGLRAAYVMPEEIVDAIVRLEERSIRAEEACAVREAERHLLLREANRGQDLLAQAFHRIADSLDRLAERAQPGGFAAAASAGDASGAARVLAGQGSGHHRGHPYGRGRAGARSRSGRCSVQRRGDRHAYWSVPRPGPGLCPASAAARMHTAVGVRSGRFAGLRPRLRCASEVCVPPQRRVRGHCQWWVSCCE